MLIVVARIKAKKDKVEELRKELEALVNPTRQEPGCLQYDLHQSSDEPALFYFYEKWKDEASFGSHFETPHIKTMRQQTASMLAEPPEIQRVKKVTRD